MPKSVLDEPRFRNETAAYAYVEGIVWPNGRICPHCGVVDKSGALKGKSTRIGTYKCYACRKPFTVKIGTIFEKSHVPMHIWLQAMHIMCSSKKGFSANQFCRVLGVDFKTGWFIGHRIREAMAEHSDVFGPMGGEGKTLEIDETFTGFKGDKPSYEFHNEGGWRRRGAWSDKIPVVTLVERGGKARSIKAENVTARELRRIVFAHADTKSDLMTDQLSAYRGIGRRFASHESVNHSEEEWARGKVHTNTVEGFFSIFKRGMRGIYQHCSERHLHRYLAEFDFRYSNRIALGVDDVERTERAIRGIIGKRLTYRTTSGKAAAEATTA
jgi:transposase-like protein